MPCAHCLYNLIFTCDILPQLKLKPCGNNSKNTFRQSLMASMKLDVYSSTYISHFNFNLKWNSFLQYKDFMFPVY